VRKRYKILITSFSMAATLLFFILLLIVAIILSILLALYLVPGGCRDGRRVAHRRSAAATVNRSLGHPGARVRVADGLRVA